MLGLRERMEENGIAPGSREGKRSAAAPPDPEVVDKPSRRRFSPSYKLRILEEVDGCTEPGEVGRIHKLTAKLSEQNSPLAEACEEALRLKAPDVKARTLEVYTTGLAHFRRFAGLLSVREALTTDQIQEFKAFRKEEGVKNETINNDLIAVSILTTLALRRNWIDKRPEISRFTTKIRINYIESDQIAPYMATLRRQYRPLFQLLVGSGMRLGEAEALRVCDLRWAAQRLGHKSRTRRPSPACGMCSYPSGPQTRSGSTSRNA